MVKQGGAGKMSFWIAEMLLSSSILVFAHNANATLPTGGQIISGAGAISQDDSTMTINQATDKLVVDWNTFSIGKDHSVNFQQPSSNSVALNQVLGNDVSVIQGALNANGQIFLVNPNGILFSPTAQVNTGGLIASTQSISQEDFLAGNYKFSGTSNSSIINEGNIVTPEGGTVALIAATIINQGTITTPQGTTLFGSGNTVVLDLGGPVKIEVLEGALDSLIEQGGAIRADGGKVYLTAKAANDLATSTINHTGIIEARTLSTGEKGEIMLLGDMKHGTLNANGTLDASAPHGGDGGFIETSAAHVDVKKDIFVKTKSKSGENGNWLIDPYNYIISADQAMAISNALNEGNVIINTIVSNIDYGSDLYPSEIADIIVNSPITKTGENETTLSLIAANTIVLNSPISSVNSKLNMQFDADNDDGYRDGSGIIIVNHNLDSKGGYIKFGTGTSIPINGVDTMVGGDVYFGGNNAQTITTEGGDLSIYGETILANPQGVTINTAGGNVFFARTTNSGNLYTESVGFLDGGTWEKARDHAKSGTGANIGDTYLATITSRLENVMADRAVNYQPSWLGGRRVVGVGTDNLWRWVTGPKGLMDNGKGMVFFQQNGAGGIPMNGAYSNWNEGQPNNYPYSDNLSEEAETALQLVGNLGQWDDLSHSSDVLESYVKETNLANSPLKIEAGTGTVTLNGTIGGNKALDSLNINAASVSVEGDITTSDLINITTQTGDINLSGNVTSASTTANAIILHAGASKKAGDATGGNIVLSSDNPAFTTGPGGRAILYTGSIPNSTKVATTVGLNNSRYNGDREISNFTRPLGNSGTYAIFREQPILTIKANNFTKVYNRLSYTNGNGYTISDAVNGDTFPNSIVTYSGNSQGAINAGSYAIVPTNFTDNPGYQINYQNGNLTVEKAVLTYNANHVTSIIGSQFPNFTGTVTGFVNGDDQANSTTGVLTFITNATSASPAGTYAINGSGLNAINYNFIQNNANSTAFTLTNAEETNTNPVIDNTQGTVMDLVEEMQPIFPVNEEVQLITSSGNDNEYNQSIGSLEMIEIDSSDTEIDEVALTNEYREQAELNDLKILVVDEGMKFSENEEIEIQ